MKFNPTFLGIVKNIFFFNVSVNNINLNENLCLDSNNVFKKSLVVEINDNEVEIPIIAKNHFENYISQNIRLSSICKIKKIILPLYDNSDVQEKKTFDSIINKMFTTGYAERLQKIVTSKKEIYYGGRGIILDENFIPLLLCTLVARKVCSKDSNNMVYYRAVCHVNPKVFLESNKLINKGIIKKLIPCFTNINVCFPNNNYYFTSIPENNKVKVIVDNFDRFFVEPVSPAPSVTTNETLNECLVDNIDDIIGLI